MVVGKYRRRIHSTAKIRIKKGMSSESNPTKHRHREAAGAARVGSLSTGVMEAVDDRPEAANCLLNKLGEMKIGREQEYSNKSMVSDGAVSRISQFTACSNRSFDSVHRFWKSGSRMQKEVVAVLAAVTELIKERMGSETDVEYFAVLLTTLEGSPISEPCRTAAVSFLLQLIVKKVPKEVLQSQFTKTVQVLYTKMLENSGNVEGSALKYLLSVLGVVLRAQPACVWDAANTKNLVVSVAALCAHEKPWVRTMARRVVRTVLTDPVTAMENGVHAASSSVGTFVQQHLQSAVDSNSGDVIAVRYLCLLEGIMHKMPSNLFKQLAETILRALAVADRMVKCSALQCLHRCLQRQPCDAALSVEVNVLLVRALRYFSPPSEDVTVCAYWMQALAEAHVCLTAKDPYRCYSLLPSTLEIIVSLFDSGNEQLAQVTYQIIARLTERSVQDNEKCAKSLLTLLDRALNVHSTTVWRYVLRAEMRLFEVAGTNIIGEEFSKAMKTLSLLREGNECLCRQELDFTVGCAVRHVGAPAVLSAIPLGIDADAAVLDTEFTHSWIVPILRVNLHNAPLEFFSSHFLPLAIKIHRRLESMDPLARRLYMTLQAQLWELLPSFCDSPSDIEHSFPQLAPVLGAALNERSDLRSSILTALRRIVRFSLLPDASPERAEVVSAYAKNFMPLLFNLYTMSNGSNSGDKGERMAILETIRVYAELTPKRLVAQFIDAAITKANDAFGNAVKQARILDILCAIVRNADCTTLGKVMGTINPWFAISEMQKKAFRILEEISSKRFTVFRIGCREVANLIYPLYDPSSEILSSISFTGFPASLIYEDIRKCEQLLLQVEDCVLLNNGRDQIAFEYQNTLAVTFAGLRKRESKLNMSVQNANILRRACTGTYTFRASGNNMIISRVSPELDPFFSTSSSDFVNALLRPIATVVAPARAAFCACIQAVVDIIDDLPKLSDFCLKSLDAVVLTLDKSNSTHARSNASKCLQHMFNKLIQIGGENNQHPSAVLADLLSRVYEMTTPVAGYDNGTVELCTARSTLVALNIIAQKQLRVLNGTHISRVIAHGCAWIGDGRAPVRILVIRLFRVLVQKLPEYALQQYRDVLLSSVFDAQPTCDVTSKVRKANRLLLEVLITKYSADILLKHTSKLEWVKQIRNIEKLNRRKERQMCEGPSKKDSEDGSMSGTGSRLTSQTAGADTILKLLEDSDASDSESEGKLGEIRSRTGNVWLKEDTDMDDTTDLLDRKRMILKVATYDPDKLVRQQTKIKEQRKTNNFGFKTSREGKLVIVDDDDLKGKSRKRRNGLDELDDDFTKHGKKTKEDTSSDSDEDSDNLHPKSLKSSSRVSTWRTTTQSIHRGSAITKRKARCSKGVNGKNTQKLQPYAYVPLRRKGVKQDILKLLKPQRKVGRSKGKKMN